MLINATGLHRKFGGAQLRDLRFSGPILEMFFDRGIMGLLPTQGDEKRFLFSGSATPSPLSSRPERSAVEGPAVQRSLLGDVFSTERNPDFPLRTADKGLRVRFSLRKPHGVDQSYGSRQEIRGTAAEGICSFRPLSNTSQAERHHSSRARISWHGNEELV